MAETEILTIAAAGALATAALQAAGASEAAAASTARALVAAEIDGQGGHGLSRVPSYAGQLRAGKVDGRTVPVLAEVRPGAVRVDAGHGFAYPAFDLALPELAARARACGIAAAAIFRSHHFGVAGHHCERLAQEGLIGFVYGNSPKALAPWGATEKALGTNPIAFAAPMAWPGPLVIDLALTRVARGKILAAREVGEPIPEGWALDAQGRPTTDAAAALKGSMAPIGDAKGAALALMVEVMSACLAGAALSTEASSLFEPEGPPPDLGQTVIAVDAGALSGGAFAARMADLAAVYDALEGARLPGTRRFAAREKARADGLVVKSALLAQIRGIAGG